MKHIIIDARLYGPKHTGIGRYTKNLLLALSQQPHFSDYKFTLIIYSNLENEIKSDLGDKFNYFSTDIPHYSLKEQILLPLILIKLKPNLVHFTHFNKPIFYFGKSVVTIHDLIKHFFKGKETTTQNPVFYWVKHLSYLLITYNAVKTSSIIVPSNYWRDYLIKKYRIDPKKITTTYEAVDPGFIQNKVRLNNKSQDYIIYTGNLYPHKNIKIIIKALSQLPNLKLKIICARNYFSQKLSQAIKKLDIQKQVEFLGFVDDKKFKDIYSHALALVHPSLMEGFSLTGLEAMALNCPVISSNSSCLPEIYGNSVLYFNPNNSDELVGQIKKLQNSSKLRQKLINLGQKQVSLYSWTKTASKTLEIYKKIK